MTMLDEPLVEGAEEAAFRARVRAWIVRTLVRDCFVRDITGASPAAVSQRLR